MNQPDESTAPPHLDSCEICGEKRSSRASSCTHCGDKRPSPPDRWDRARTIAVTIFLPALTMMVGLYQFSASKRFNEEKSDREAEWNKYTAAQEENWKKYYAESSETKERNDLAIKILEKMSPDKAGTAEEAVLLALCFACSNQLEPDVVVPMLTHRARQTEAFAIVFKQNLLKFMERAKAANNQKLQNELTEALSLIDQNKAMQSAGSTEEKKAIIKKNIDAGDAPGAHVLVETMTAAAADPELKEDKALLKETASSLGEAMDRTVEQVTQETVDQVVQLSGNPEILPGQSQETFVDKSEDFLRDEKRVNPEDRVKSVEHAFRGEERFVVVYSREDHKKTVEELKAWAITAGLVPAVWNTRDINRVLQRPATVELRYRMDSAEVKNRADELVPLIKAKLSKGMVLKTKPLPGSVIAANEFEVWFPK